MVAGGRASQDDYDGQVCMSDAVRLEPGAEKPVRIVIEMSNSAGVFQLDELFRSKLSGSGLEPYVELLAEIEGEEKKLVDRYQL